MDSVTIFQIIVNALLWLATIVLLLGQGGLLGMGLSFMPVKEMDSPEDQRRQCRYIALRLLLPLSIVFTILTVGEITQTEWWQQLTENAWLGILFFLAVFAYIFFIVTQLNSGKYKNKRK